MKSESSMYTGDQYRNNYPTWHIEDSPWKANQVIDMLQRHRVPFCNACEIGSGSGELLRRLGVKYPFAQFVGYEISPYALELCKSRKVANVTFVNGSMPPVGEKYDLCVCLDVFEHVENYMDFLKQLRERATYALFHVPLDLSVVALLRGTLVAGRRKVGHIHYFTAETALATLEDCGYGVIDKRFTRGFAERPGKTMMAILGRLPRHALFSISPNWMVRLLGGCSLLVLARGADQ